MADQDPPICAAFYWTMEAIASQVTERPLPRGLTTVEIGDWKLAVNVGTEPADFEGSPLPGYHVIAIHKVYFIIATFGPDGGAIGGGMPEDDYIEGMKAFARPEGASNVEG